MNCNGKIHGKVMNAARQSCERGSLMGLGCCPITVTPPLEADPLNPLNLCKHKGHLGKWIFRRVGGWINGCCCCCEKDKIAKIAAKTCAGGNVLLERGHIVSSDEYEAIKEMVVKDDF